MDDLVGIKYFIIMSFFLLNDCLGNRKIIYEEREFSDFISRY